jgi:hypothetical protein
MELGNKEKNFLLKLVGEGLKTREINRRAAKHKPPFQVSRAQVDYYRKTREVTLQTITDESESSALREGYALKTERVESLKIIAQKLFADLTRAGGAGLWLPKKKALGTGELMQIVEHLDFNAGELGAFLRVLDEIAKETLDRTYQRREVPVGDDDEGDDEGDDAHEFKVKIEYETKPAS